MRILILLLIIVGLAFSCAQETEPKSQFLHPDSIVNPNGDSELALVMRNLHFEADKVREKLANNEEADLTTLRALTIQLTTAEPTDSNVLDADYYMLSDMILKELNDIPESQDQVVEFNSMVSACVTCHRNTCPGPIDKINKLKINS